MKWIPFAPQGNVINLGPGVFDVLASSLAQADLLAKMENNSSLLEIWQKKISQLTVAVDGTGIFTLDKLETVTEGKQYKAWITVYVRNE